MQSAAGTRRQVLLGAGAFVMAQSAGALSESVNGFLPISPQEAGFAPDLEVATVCARREFPSDSHDRRLSVIIA
jgi:hypothetical protein